MHYKDCIKFYSKSLELFDLLKEEIKICNKIYDNKNSKTLKKYYPNLLKNEANLTFKSHYYAIRLVHLVKFVRKGINILDAGCGVGTEAIFCGILGAKVIGVDLSTERIDAAKTRLNFYQKKLNKKLDIEFFNQNILDISGNFDIIWLNESISHISPFFEFIKFVYKNLKKGGKLIIADRNNLNPYVYFYNKKEQKKTRNIYIIRKDPKTGKSIPYAVERCFTLSKIKELLSDLFQVSTLTVFGYYPLFFFNRFKKLCIKSENLFSKIPFLKSIAGGYVIISIKLD